MLLVGVEHVLAIANGTAFDGKMVINARGAAEGIAYADEYKGNALAAMLAPGSIELRFHRAFSDAQVAELIRELANEPELGFVARWGVTYRGHPITR